jgi:hypothetical protein
LKQFYKDLQSQGGIYDRKHKGNEIK